MTTEIFQKLIKETFYGKNPLSNNIPLTITLNLYNFKEYDLTCELKFLEFYINLTLVK